MATLPIYPHTPLEYNAMPLFEVSRLSPFRLHFGDDLCLLGYPFVHLGTLAWFVAVQFCLGKDCVSYAFPEFLTLSRESKMHGMEFRGTSDRSGRPKHGLLSPLLNATASARYI
jgi:hypothetical protein